ncbi:protein max-like protein [Leptotrombidium deliense]|uniref:Protein max n=1 Tax=Leptotrombidium deliense TaxID=299467 RepID=A0A443STZ7_9ACAR|nr:protein max-like protein [Leptotrombidium deliense]
MSDDDKDVDIDSDDEDLGSSTSANENSSKHSFQSQADKRAHHNALERKRRDHIKDSFTSLRDSVPSLHGEKVKPYKASRAQILKKAAEYIQQMRRKNVVHQQDIDDIKKQNKVLEEQSECFVVYVVLASSLLFVEVVRALEKAKSSGLTNFSGTSILDNKAKSESISSFDGISDSESSEGDGAATNGSNGSLSTLGQPTCFGPPHKKAKLKEKTSFGILFNELFLKYYIFTVSAYNGFICVKTSQVVIEAKVDHQMSVT